MFGSTRQAVAASQPGNLKLRRGSSASSRRLWGDQRDSDRVPRRSSSPPLPVAIPVPASGCQCALALRLASHGPRGRAGRVRVGGWQLESVKPESGAQSAGTRSRGRRGACWSQAWSKGPVFLLFIWFRWSSCRNLCVQRRWAPCRNKIVRRPYRHGRRPAPVCYHAGAVSPLGRSRHSGKALSSRSSTRCRGSPWLFRTCSSRTSVRHGSTSRYMPTRAACDRCSGAAGDGRRLELICCDDGSSDGACSCQSPSRPTERLHTLNAQPGGTGYGGRAGSFEFLVAVAAELKQRGQVRLCFPRICARTAYSYSAQGCVAAPHLPHQG